MNILTIYLYLMDVLLNVQVFLCLTGSIGLAIIAGRLAIVAIRNADSYGDDLWPYKLKASIWLSALALTLIFIGGLIPSKETMQLMAVSQAGEMVVTNPEVRSVLNDVKEVLQKQLQDMKKD